MIMLSDLVSMYEKSIVNIGNQARVQQVLKQAERGEKVTIGFLGGSITMGCGAEPMESNGYAAQTIAWFREKYGSENITYVNAGIGATDSYLGVHRVEKDLLCYEPDLVIVEFSVNDERECNEESYDSLIRKIYLSKSAPAVVLLFLTQRNGCDYQEVHERIGKHYDLPMISYRNAVLEYITSGRLPWTMIAKEEDGTHPGNMGHFLIASLLVRYFEEISKKKKMIGDTVFKGPYTTDRYKNARLYDNTNLLPTAAHDFEPILLKEAQFSNGWRTTKGGDIAFYLNGKNIGIIYYGTQDELSGMFDIYVDEEKVTTLNGDFVGKWGSYAEYQELIRTEKEKVHKVVIRKGKESEKLQFTILGFTVS